MSRILANIFERVYATDAPKLITNTPIATSDSKDIIGDSLNTIYSTGFEWLSAIAGIVAIFFIIWNGIRYISSGGDTKKAEDAKKGLINAIIGIAAIAAVWGIITFATGLGSLISTKFGK